MDLTILLGGLVGGAGGVYALVKLIRMLWSANRRVVHTLDLVPRMAALTEELSSDSGNSIKDKVDRTAAAVVRTEAKVDQVRQRLDDHIRNHHGA